jgi:hypothetical protein
MFVPDEAQVRAAVDFNERLNVPQIRPFYRWEVDLAWMAGTGAIRRFHGAKRENDFFSDIDQNFRMKSIAARAVRR